MTTCDYKLPGKCYVKQITGNQQGLLLKPKLLEPMQANIMQAIEELQIRQDELNRYFEPAILRLLNLLTTAQQRATH